jgi:hypothetical protein
MYLHPPKKGNGIHIFLKLFDPNLVIENQLSKLQ